MSKRVSDVQEALSVATEYIENIVDKLNQADDILSRNSDSDDVEDLQSAISEVADLVSDALYELQ